jgi:hypothetical protein
MLPYLLLAGLTAYGSWAWRDRRLTLALVLLFSLAYFVLAGFRFHVGTDWNNYLRIYYASKERDFGELAFQSEWAWGALLWLIHAGDGQFMWINIACALVAAAGLGMLLAECDEPMLGVTAALPVLCYAVGMSAVRQTFAIGIECALIAHWHRLNTPAKAGIIIVASGFHLSALFLFILLASENLRFGWQRWVSGALIALGVVYLLNTNADHVSYYSETYTGEQGANYAPGALYHLALVAIPSALYLLWRKRWEAVYGRSNIVLVLAITAVACIPAIALSPAGADRIGLYCWPAAIIIYSGIPKLFLQPQQQALARLAIVGGSLVTLLGWLLLANEIYAYLPYTFMGDPIR